MPVIKFPGLARLDRAQKAGLATMLVVMLFAAFFRLEQFTVIPPGTHTDIAQSINDGLRISRAGNFPLMLDTRPEPLWRFVLAGAVLWTGGAPYTERLTGIMVGLLTVAATYRATLALLRLWPWITRRAQRWGAVLAATALVANVALQFINRQGYRTGLLPLAIALFIWALAHAWRVRRSRAFFIAGLAAGFPVHTYTAGLVVPPIAVLILLYMLVVGSRHQRPRWRDLAVMLAAMALILLPQVFLFLRIPDLYWRLRSAQTFTVGAPIANQLSPIIQSLPDLVERLRLTLSAFYQTGYPYPDYNTPISPFLNPLFAGLAVVGLLVAVRNWRSLPLPLCLGLLLGLMSPGTLSMAPHNPIRLSGTFVPLGILAGVGTSALLTLGEQLPMSVRRRSLSVVSMTALLAALVAGPIVARQQFLDHWQTEALWADPEYWLSFPHYYSINVHDLLNRLKGVDTLVYVPMTIIDIESAGWYLTAEAYPQVEFATLDDPLSIINGLPAAEVWYPHAREFNVPLTKSAEQFALLQPGPDNRDGKIVILPPLAMGSADALRQRARDIGEPISNNRDWTLGWRLPVQPEALTAPPDPLNWNPVGARFGDVVELVGYEAPLSLQAGETVRVTFYWRVLKPINFDLFSAGSLLDPDLQVRAQHEDLWFYRWLHPSVFWQPGDMVSDVRLLTIQEDAPAGLYTLFVNVYTPPGLDNLLPVYHTDGQRLPDPWLALRNHRIAMPATRLPRDALPVDARFGNELELVAYSSDIPLEAVQAGDRVTLRLFWRALQQPMTNYTFFLHIANDDSNILVQQDLQPYNGRYPTNVWAENEMVAVDFQVTIPAATIVDDLSWHVGAYSFPSLKRLPVTQAGAMPDDRRARLDTTTLAEHDH